MILCIETSGAIGSVSLADTAGNCVAKRMASAVNAHAEQIPVMAAQLIELAESKASGIEAVAVNKGPGSYTGLRIGSSLAKGLCFGYGIPLIACDGLEVMARKAAASGCSSDLYLCVLDARRDEVFFAVYGSSFEIIEPLGTKILSEDVWSEYRGKNVVFCGDAVAKLKRLVPAFTDYTEFTEILDASWFSETAANLNGRGKWADLAYFEPDYGKAFYTGNLKK